MASLQSNQIARAPDRSVDSHPTVPQPTQPINLLMPKPPAGSRPAEKEVSLRARIGALSVGEEVAHEGRHPAHSKQAKVPEDDDSDESSEDQPSEASEMSDDEDLENECLDEFPVEGKPTNAKRKGIDAMSLHHHHCGSKAQRTTHTAKPVSYPGCNTAKDIVKMAALSWHPRSGAQSEEDDARCAISAGQLIATGQNLRVAIPLMHASLASEQPKASKLCAAGEAMTLICLVAQSDKPSQDSNEVARASEKVAPKVWEEKQHIRTVGSTLLSGMIGRFGGQAPPPIAASVTEGNLLAASNLKGWLFVCPSAEVTKVLNMLGTHGVIREEEFRRFYDVDEAGKAGQGSFGKVLRATAKQDNRGTCFAAKQLKSSVKDHTVLAEIAMLVAAQGHPTIVGFWGTFYDTSLEAPMWVLLFDYYAKGDLYDIVAQGRAMTEREILPLLHDLLTALVHLKGRGIFHRDVKPENLLVSPTSRAVLTDFGIATHVNNVGEMHKKSGTIGYAAPEMLLGQSTGCEGDAFGAGIVLFFMVSKSTPFLAPTPALITRRTIDCKLNLEYGCFEKLSQPCRDLMTGFIKKVASERLTPEEVLAKSSCFVHGRFQSGAARTEPELAPLQPRRKPGEDAGDQGGQQGAIGGVKKVGAAPSMGALPIFSSKGHRAREQS